MVLGTLGTVEAGLHAMGARIGGSGVAAAAGVIAEALAGAAEGRQAPALAAAGS
jgi:hypothetical protein